MIHLLYLVVLLLAAPVLLGSAFLVWCWYHPRGSFILVSEDPRLWSMNKPCPECKKYGTVQNFSGDEDDFECIICHWHKLPRAAVPFETCRYKRINDVDPEGRLNTGPDSSS